jgi:hypothetical protein
MSLLLDCTLGIELSNLFVFLERREKESKPEIAGEEDEEEVRGILQVIASTGKFWYCTFDVSFILISIHRFGAFCFFTC